MAEAALNQVPFGSATKSGAQSAPGPSGLRQRPASRSLGHYLVYDLQLSGIVGAGTSAVLISLKAIFFEPSTQSGLAGRFLDWG
jgi:hypothetical protein